MYPCRPVSLCRDRGHCAATPSMSWSRTLTPGQPFSRRKSQTMTQAPPAHQAPHDKDDWAPTPDAAATCPHRESGRCMALASGIPVPTPTGWRTLGRLGPGDRVFDHEGEPCNVTAVCPSTKQDVFHIVFDDDFSLVAGAGQPWVTLTHRRRFRVHKRQTQPDHWASMLMPLATEDIRSCPKHERGLMLRESMHSVPLALPLKLPERPLRIHPYLLGLWLGDGTSTAAAITCHSDDEPHYRSRAEAAGERVAHPEQAWGHPDMCPDPGAFATFLDQAEAFGTGAQQTRPGGISPFRPRPAAGAATRPHGLRRVYQ